MKKEKKDKYIDDGHTIYSMDVDAKWSVKHNSKQKVYVSKDERKLLIKAAYRAYFPKLLLVLFAFLLAVLLIFFWLRCSY